MSSFALPHRRCGLDPATELPQIVSPAAAPPEGEGWLHEIKHDGHRLVAIIAGGLIVIPLKFAPPVWPEAPAVPDAVHAQISRNPPLVAP